MKKYKVVIEEVLVKEVDIEASSTDEAYDKVSEMYYNEELVLDESDFDSDVTIRVIGQVMAIN